MVNKKIKRYCFLLVGASAFCLGMLFFAQNARKAKLENIEYTNATAIQTEAMQLFDKTIDEIREWKSMEDVRHCCPNKRVVKFFNMLLCN
jgi:hypothetical protein